jgi:hypothetical protein
MRTNSIDVIAVVEEVTPLVLKKKALYRDSCNACINWKNRMLWMMDIVLPLYDSLDHLANSNIVNMM